MGRSGRSLLALLFALHLGAQSMSKLPDWARPHATGAFAATPPPDVDAWVLLDRTEIAYVGSGTIKMKRYRLTRVVTERGLDEGHFRISGLGGQTSEVSRLKGWNLRPDGEVKTLDSDQVIKREGRLRLNGDDFTSGTDTTAQLLMVVKGSLVAFESEQVLRNPMGPVEWVFIMESHPIRQWELEVAKGSSWFQDLRSVRLDLDLRHGPPWLKQARLVPGQSLTVKDVPALPKDERATPHWRNLFPWVLVRFQDPGLKGVPGQDSWDAQAAWIQSQFESRITPVKTVDTTGQSLLDSLQAIHRWMSRELTYKQVYLTPERGWIPEPTGETLRKRYGDCKDLTACFLGLAKGLGLRVYPVLARIIEGDIEPDEPVHAYAFNHAISAIQLDQSLGLPSEVETPQGRFLLVDPTDRFTPLGYLPGTHRGRRVMICLEGRALWVTVLDSAIHRSEMALDLVGEAHADGRLSGTLKVRASGQEGDLLRQLFLEADPKVLRQHLPSLLGLDLTPEAPFEVLRHSQPLVLDGPFELEVRFTASLAYRSGTECTLDLPGVPAGKPSLQKPGQVRLSPIQVRDNSHLEVSAAITVPARVEPILPLLNQETPFRKLSWTAEAKPAGHGSLIRVSLIMDRKDSDYDQEHLAAGQAAWKQDRSLLTSLRSDGLAFKRLP